MPPYAPYFSRRSASATWIFACLAIAAVPPAFFYFHWPLPAGTVLFGVTVSAGGVLALLLTPTRVVVIDATGVLLTRTTPVGLFTRSTVIPIEKIRRLRYRSDLYPIRGSSFDRMELRFFVDVITTDGEIHTLLTWAGFPPGLDAQQLARQLGVPYEEYLDAGAGSGPLL